MRMVNIHKAQAVADRPVESITIVIDLPIPEFRGKGWERSAKAYHDGNAQALVDALIESLPGGTLDRVLSKLLDYKASLWRIPWDRLTQGSTDNG